MERLGSLVGYGNFGRVYRLASDPEKVVKIPHYWTWKREYDVRSRRPLEGYDLDRSAHAHQNLQKEAHLNEHAFKRGLPLPCPQGMCFIEMEKGSPLPGFVAAYVPGKTLERLSDEVQRALRSRAEEMIVNAKQQGFMPAHDAFLNMIWDYSADRLYFCDLGLWNLTEIPIKKPGRVHSLWAQVRSLVTKTF